MHEISLSVVRPVIAVFVGGRSLGFSHEVLAICGELSAKDVPFEQGIRSGPDAHEVRECVFFSLAPTFDRHDEEQEDCERT